MDIEGALEVDLGYLGARCFRVQVDGVGQVVCDDGRGGPARSTQLSLSGPSAGERSLQTSLFGACAVNDCGVVRRGTIMPGFTFGLGQMREVEENVGDAVFVAVGLYDACAQRASGEVLCWGSPSSGLLGDGVDAPFDDRNFVYEPTVVPMPTK
ncbi:MAG: hypothetical protein U0414_10515 [Polyangiaceae bacterium]